MVFSSIPLYLDPSNWHQQPNQHQANANNRPHELLPPLPSPPSCGGDGGGSGRLGLVADEATQLAKMLPPDQTTQKCPRCESTNTKFCYYNNYNLSQPRHFCKTCRRYWTRGGALRNVPVGGGCRRSKKNKKSSRSKSPSSTDNYKPTLSNSTSSNPSGIVTPDLIGRFPQLNNPTFMASLQNMNRYGMGNISSTNHMGLQIGGHGLTSVGGVLQQFPFLNGFQSTSAVSYPFQSESFEAAPYGLVKLEDLNSSRNPPSVSENNNGYYSWTDLSRLASSSTSHLL
ncbi:hypothetical protein TanjilG_30827 [Lupinus angustifolius]|uniref:Dof zinc finger protein n=1 Tax=Lupinus angustifolius TaxID=3871 RepID=A0A394DGD7_LUPAN|nr:PREDICTED: dof zinc finger protein DOF3.6-like isoform X2 [Lupinus angustifolius]OIW22035.1 hypothetical protein TanjilG_30827 [Lupinus angustifolius]